MTRSLFRNIVYCTIALAAPQLSAQRHNGGSSPPTAPPRAGALAPQPTGSPVNAGTGAIQFVAVNYGVPAPQSLTRQLRADDDRTRGAALSAIGAPGQYFQRGHVATPRSIEFELVSLGNDDELDALLTVELDQHIVTAVLVPDDNDWRRVATLTVADPFNDPNTTPDTFVRTARSMLERGRYRAIFHATSTNSKGDATENEVHLRVINKRAVITLSFVSASRECTAAPAPIAIAAGKHPETPATGGGCNIVRRWLQPDPSDPFKRFTLVTATGHVSAHDAASSLNDPSFNDTSLYEASHLRSFTCQLFAYSDQTQHFDPAGVASQCPVK